MNLPQILIVFFVTWWLVFLPALSIGIQGQHESEEGVVDGTEAGAPVAPMLWKKALWATIGAVVLTGAAMIVIPMLAP
ncbi:MAG: DUF1467 family protein [Pseudomonadota bacterium]